MKQAKTERRKVHRVMHYLDHYLPQIMARTLVSYLNKQICKMLRKGPLV